MKLEATVSVEPEEMEQEESQERVLVCEICREDLARFQVDDVYHPVNGGMFTTLHPEREYPLPWPSPAELIDWEAMRCPFCRYRPMSQEKRLLTNEGWLEFDTPEEMLTWKVAKGEVKKKRSRKIPKDQLKPKHMRERRDVSAGA